MKIDCLQEGSDDCPLVRLYEFQIAEARRLKDTFNALAVGSIERIELDTIGGIESIDGTQLVFRRGSQDDGLVEDAAQCFSLVLSAESWQRMAGLTEPSCEGAVGYQWLCEVGRIRLLLSKDGAW